MKKAMLIRESLSDDLSSGKPVYSAKICLPSAETVRIDGFVTEPNAVGRSQVKLVMYFQDAGEETTKDIILSKVDFRFGEVKLECLIIPDSYRNIGLGTIAFKCWLKVIEAGDKKYLSNIYVIRGSIGKGSDLTPEYSKKLYRSFHKYRCFNGKKLNLNFWKFIKNELEYNVV